MKLTGVVIAAAFSIFSPAAHAEEHSNLEEGFPTELDDAFPIAEHARSFLARTHYVREEDGNHTLVVEPAVEMHITPNWPFKILFPFERDAESGGLREGNVALEVFHNINPEYGWVPAFAVAGQAAFPTASDAQGVDTTLKLIASKDLSTNGRDRAHVNIAWKHNAGREEGERRNRYVAVVGYSRTLTSKTVLIADYVREQELEEGRTAQLVEFAVRQSLAPGTILSLGTGIGVGPESPDYHVTLGIQVGF